MQATTAAIILLQAEGQVYHIMTSHRYQAHMIAPILFHMRCYMEAQFLTIQEAREYRLLAGILGTPQIEAVRGQG